jgi:NAD(P)-dependent dehydrogenase (short-subunit alcohol dehydrogenase family)
LADVALVCGGRGALGSAIVEALRDRGDEVVLADKDDVDLTDANAVEKFWDGLERTPRWLVNAAGGYRTGTVADSEPGDLEFLAELNVATAWWSCRAAGRRMREGDAILNVGARPALMGGAGSAAYAVSKAAVVRLTEVLALELAERRVRVNAILPSVIDTPSNREHGITGGVPPAQLASVVSFLLSDAAAAVSGAVVPVYGFA